MTASPGDGEHAAREGYYPDPSIPGYIRYWNGAAWVPGTSRPAPAGPAPVPDPAPAAAPAVPAPALRVPGPAPVPAAVPGAAPARLPVAAPAVRADETGPVFLDETSMTETLPEPAAEPAVWQADPAHQAGFGGPRDHRVSWGSPSEAAAAEDAAPREAASPARAAGAAESAAGPSAPASAQPAAGILSARSPAARTPAPSAPAAAPAAAEGAREHAPSASPAPQWPDAPGAEPGITSSWPEAVAAPAARPRPAEPAPSSAPEGPPAREQGPAASARPEVWAPRPAGARPRIVRPESAAPPAGGGAAVREPRGTEEGRAAAPAATAPAPEAGASRAAASRAVFERMAERAVRPAGFVRRAVARALDTVVYAAVAAAAAVPQLPAATEHVRAKVDAARASGRTTTVWLLDGPIAGRLALVLGAVLLFGILYEVLPTARWGRTPGKKLLGVRVLTTAGLRPPRFGAALGRWLAYAFLGLPGSLWALVDRPRRQAWHDKAARTYVAR
ncbi:RDD family protein [Streptomyces sp. NPDC004311]|uniref:RDD family protein n=1 Tax=Streptomyces sp. NPDC004311 TaxID=3364698 RepID=UPI00368F8134